MDTWEMNCTHEDMVKAALEHWTVNRFFRRFANLTGADLRNASLYEAYLANADLTGANLSNAKGGTVKRRARSSCMMAAGFWS